MMDDVRVTMPCTLTRVSMWAGSRSRMVRVDARLNARTCRPCPRVQPEAGAQLCGSCDGAALLQFSVFAA